MRIVKFWRKDREVHIDNLEDYFSFWSRELDTALINSEEIRLLDDEGIQPYKINLIVIYTDVNNKYKEYKSYFLFKAYNPDYENVNVRLSQLFRKVNGEIQDRKRKVF